PAEIQLLVPRLLKEARKLCIFQAEGLMSVLAGAPTRAVVLAAERSGHPGPPRPDCRAIFRASLVLLLLAASMASRAAVFGSLRGVVHDDSHRPIAAATVELKSASSGAAQRTQTDPQGRFAFASVAVGEYTLNVQARGFVDAVQSITVVSGVS